MGAKPMGSVQFREGPYVWLTRMDPSGPHGRLCTMRPARSHMHTALARGDPSNEA